MLHVSEKAIDISMATVTYETALRVCDEYVLRVNDGEHRVSDCPNFHPRVADSFHALVFYTPATGGLKRREGVPDYVCLFLHFCLIHMLQIVSISSQNTAVD